MRRALPRCSWLRLSVPDVIEVQSAGRLRRVLANLVGTGEPAKIAGSRRVRGNEESHGGRWLLLALGH